MDFKIRLSIFLICFSIGMLYVYSVTPAKKAIVKYPTPYNAGKIIYKDKNDGTCYKYKAKQIDCPEKGVVPQPFSTMNNVESI